MKMYSLLANSLGQGENEGPVCEGYNFSERKCIRSEHWNDAIDQIEKGQHIGIYMDEGINPAMIEFVSAAVVIRAAYCVKANEAYTFGITCYHYNHKTQKHDKCSF